MRRYVLLTIFITVLIVANVTAGVKLVNLWGFVVPVGFVAYAITFTVTDIVAEVWGKAEARRFVWCGFMADVAMLILIYLGFVMPALNKGMQELYSKAFTPVARIVVASMIAYLISQNHDVWAFHKWKEITRGRWLWLRNNASTIVSQGIDTVIFITLAFYGVIPNNVLLRMILCQWLWKIVVALCDTPFVYFGVRLVGK